MNKSRVPRILNKIRGRVVFAVVGIIVLAGFSCHLAGYLLTAYAALGMSVSVEQLAVAVGTVRQWSVAKMCK